MVTTFNRSPAPFAHKEKYMKKKSRQTLKLKKPRAASTAPNESALPALLKPQSPPDTATVATPPPPTAKAETDRASSAPVKAEFSPPIEAETSVTHTTDADTSDTPVPSTPTIPIAAQLPAVPTPLPCSDQWHAQYEAVVGLLHRNANPPLPCQDAVISTTAPRPLLIVADGAGSSAVSEIGSQAVITGLARLLYTLERQTADLLDQAQPNDTTARSFALLLVKHAKGILDDLAAQHRRPQKDFRCTLLLAVVGKAHVLWLKVGDGALVQEQLIPQTNGTPQSQLTSIGSVGKGEFANLTTFIDNHLQPQDVQSGLLNASGVCGLAAMSDGAAEKLVSHDGQRVAGLLGHWLHALRQQKLHRRELTRSFYSEAFCTRTSSGDDCSLALLAAVPEPA